MTGDGEAIARRCWDAINRGASADDVMAEIGDLLHADVEYVNPADALERGERRGAEGVRLAVANYLAGVGPDAEFEIEQLIERADKVFVRGRIHARGASSGIEVDGPGIGVITTLRDGLIFRMEWYWDKQEALSRFERETAG
jgi:ketosteroid isomerase-like protein